MNGEPIADYERQIYTLPIGNYSLVAKAYETSDCSGEPRFSIQHNTEVKLGSDELWDPVLNIDSFKLKQFELNICHKSLLNYCYGI